ncbi:tripartite tricarboxylate transporter substrate binding protein [Variovorax paradoxus]|nr:tripartite tricarboxylate transporter substrate binding protein [Variovorax paradoxus]MBT2305228.1 tripartite tricarboxylate transporter substrate binding protein [Variovorax paradoxus]
MIRTLLAITLWAVSTLACAQAFPDKSKPIRIVVPFGAGSGADVLARAYARAIGESGGLNAIVDNKPGAEGVIGLELAKNAAPDGYTVVFSNLSTHVLNVYQQEKLPYDPVVDFTPLVVVESVALVLNAGPSTKFRSLGDALEAARANPGKLTYGSSTASTRLAMELLEHQANVKLLAVPYKTQSQATTALVAGEIDLLMTDAVTALPFYKGGQARPLAVTSRSRISAVRDTPTLREQGIKEYEFAAWAAMFAPARTPPDVVEKLRAIFREAGQSRYVTEVLTAKASQTDPLNAAELNALIRTDLDRWGKLLREMKKTAR